MTGLDEILHLRQERIDELHRLRPGRTALVVIDMQHGFLDPGAALEVPQGREIIPNVRRLIDVCRRKQVPVVFTEFVYATSVPCLRGDPFGSEHRPAGPGEPTGFGYPSNNCLIGPGAGEGPNSAETVAELAPRPDELVVRGYAYDKFYGTPLDLALRSRDVRYLIVTGVVTDVCVNATLMSAANRDYRVTAVTDGVATLWPEIQAACFEVWKRKFARLRTTDELVEELDGF
ncbi:MAG TPA: isochorismatase family cysteine hydrolase [Thermoguttaceae bacterium]|nr:isochorismatase family cysteine hydrolase [Thermoguttaceae bacterium]